MKELLVVIDMQMTCDREPWDEGGLCHHREGAAEDPVLDCEGGEVVFTRDTHGENYLETQEGRKLPITHCIRGSEGWEIIPQLQPFAGDSRILTSRRLEVWSLQSISGMADTKQWR